MDDEPTVLRAIQRGLRRQGDRWDVTFCSTAQEAMDVLRDESYDIIVSDVTMPNMDGIELFRELRSIAPDVVRILMSGTIQSDVVMSAVPVAHQFLAKPWSLQGLIEVLEKASELRELLSNRSVRGVVGKTSSLPSFPETYHALCRAVEDPNSTIYDVVAIVERDPGIAARVLHVTNSAFFAPSKSIATLNDAVRYLGVGLLKNLVLVAEVFSTVNPRDFPRELPATAVERDALLTGQLVAKISGDIEHGYVAGLLQNCGCLIFAARLSKQWGDVVADAVAKGRPIHEAETEAFGASHAQVGAFLIGAWGLPGAIVEAIARQFAPPPSTGHRVSLSAACHIAGQLVAEACRGIEPNFDAELVESLGDAFTPESWRDMAKKLLQA